MRKQNIYILFTSMCILGAIFRDIGGLNNTGNILLVLGFLGLFINWIDY